MEPYENLIQELRDPSNIGKNVYLQWDRGNGPLERRFIFTGTKENDFEFVPAFDNRLLINVIYYKFDN